MERNYGQYDHLINKRIKCIFMDDPNPVPYGTEGTVVNVNGLGDLEVKWDNGSTLSLIMGVDKFSVLS